MMLVVARQHINDGGKLIRLMMSTTYAVSLSTLIQFPAKRSAGCFGTSIRISSQLRFSGS